MSLYEAGQVLVLALFGAFWVLSHQAKRRPDVEWLQAFKLPQLPESRRRALARRHDIIAGVELILLGLCLPIGYVILTAMTFGSFDALWIAGVALGSVLCIALGITAMIQSRREQ
jgi:hypothetical protein